MKQFLLIIALFTFFSACKKGQAEITVSGVLTDANSLQSLAGASIELIKVLDTEEVSVGTVTTDANGKYTFTTKRDRFVSLKVVASKNGYFTENSSINFNDLTVSEDNIVNIKTTGKSWVKIRLLNTSNQDAQLDIVRTAGKSGCSECCTSGYQHFYGITDTIIYCVNDAGTTYEITYFTQNPITSGTKSATTIFMDTVDILLQY